MVTPPAPQCSRNAIPLPIPEGKWAPALAGPHEDDDAHDSWPVSSTAATLSEGMDRPRPCAENTVEQGRAVWGEQTGLPVTSFLGRDGPVGDSGVA